MGAKKGHKKSGGRKKGTPNKLTKTVKEVVLGTFNDLQKDRNANLKTWAKENTTEFYKIAAKLIPNELNANATVLIAPITKEELKKAAEELGSGL